VIQAPYRGRGGGWRQFFQKIDLYVPEHIICELGLFTGKLKIKCFTSFLLKSYLGHQNTVHTLYLFFEDNLVL
jgi:hypothetical protein